MKSFLTKIAIGTCLTLFYQPTFGQVTTKIVDLGVVTEILGAGQQQQPTAGTFNTPLPGTGIFKVIFTSKSYTDTVIRGGVNVKANIANGLMFDSASVAAAMPPGWTFTLSANKRILDMQNTNVYIGKFPFNSNGSAIDGIYFWLPFTYTQDLSNKTMAANCVFTQTAVAEGYYDDTNDPNTLPNIDQSKIYVTETTVANPVDIGIQSLMLGAGKTPLTTGGTYTTTPGEGVLELTFTNGSGLDVITPNTLKINAAIPEGAKFKSTNTLPLGWTYTLQTNDRVMTIFNTNVSVSRFPYNNNDTFPSDGVHFFLEFEHTDTFTKKTVYVETQFTQDGSIRGYADPTPNVFANTATSYMTVKNSGPLPVSFSDFSVENQECDVALSWTTLSENNVDYFSIDRSIDGKSFNSIGTLKAEANNKSTKQTYTFSDQLTGNGLFFYRIRQVDLDRKNFFTSIKTVNVACGAESISLYPNPTKGVIYVSGLTKGNTVVVYNALGQIVNKVLVKEPSEVVDLTKHSDGPYLIKVFQEDKEIFNGKVIKQ